MGGIACRKKGIFGLWACKPSGFATLQPEPGFCEIYEPPAFDADGKLGCFVVAGSKTEQVTGSGSERLPVACIWPTQRALFRRLLNTRVLLSEPNQGRVAGSASGLNSTFSCTEHFV